MASVKKLYEAKPRPQKIEFRSIPFSKVPSQERTLMYHDYTASDLRDLPWYESTDGAYYAVRESDDVGAVWVIDGGFFIYRSERGWDDPAESGIEEDILDEIWLSIGEA